MKVHAIFSNKNDEVVSVGTYNLTDCYTNQMIEDYLYVICDDSVKVFRWFIEGRTVFGSCMIKEFL